MGILGVSSPQVGHVITVKVDPALRRQIQAWLNGHSFATVSEAARALLTRGLFLENKPRGQLSESAWASAYFEAKARFQSALYKGLTGPSMDKIINDAFTEAFNDRGMGTVDVTSRES
jgi:hypothetical protein